MLKVQVHFNWKVGFYPLKLVFFSHADFPLSWCTASQLFAGCLWTGCIVLHVAGIWHAVGGTDCTTSWCMFGPALHLHFTRSFCYLKHTHLWHTVTSQLTVTIFGKLHIASIQGIQGGTVKCFTGFDILLLGMRPQVRLAGGVFLMENKNTHILTFQSTLPTSRGFNLHPSTTLQWWPVVVFVPQVYFCCVKPRLWL